MNIITRQVCQIQGDCNNDQLYNKFNELTGLNLEFEIDQDFGTSCYGGVSFNEKLYPTLEQLELKIEAYKKDPDNWKFSIGYYDIVDYLRRKEILPEMDFLFDVDY